MIRVSPFELNRMDLLCFQFPIRKFPPALISSLAPHIVELESLISLPPSLVTRLILY